MTMTKKVEYIGYWSDGKNDFPMPIENQVDNNNEAIIKLEAILKLGEEVCYKGISLCRCCNKMNGNSEFLVKSKDIDYAIPEGYKHYLQEHKIKPSPLIDQIYNDLILEKKETFMQKLKKGFK